MAGAAVGDVIEVALVARYNQEQDVINVFQFQNTENAIGTDADLLDDLEELLTALVTIVKALATAYTTWTKFRARNLTQDGATLEQNFASPIEGTQAGASSPGGVSMLCNFHTEIPRRQLRKYFGVLATALLTTSGYASSTAVTQGVAAADFLLTPQETTLTTWEYGYTYPGTPAWVMVTSAVVTNVPAYQRRRKPGTGT